MAANKTTTTKASVTTFLASITDPVRRADAQALVKLLRAATGDKPVMWGPSIVGFGSYHYRYESGREGDAPRIGFSPRKGALVVYGATGFTGAPALLARLGKHTTGKGCLYLKKLADADPEVLRQIIARGFVAKRDGEG